MGVKTKVFGPVYWVFLLGIAILLDEIKGLKTSVKLEFIHLLAFMVPCVYCRISYRSFIDPEHKDFSLDVNYYTSLGMDGMKRFVYDLKNRVNLKLKEQELNDNLLQAGLHFEEEKIQHKWNKQKITFNQALRTVFREASPNQMKFWSCLVWTFGFMFCDYDLKYHDLYFRFMMFVSEVLFLNDSTSTLGLELISFFRERKSLWTLMKEEQVSSLDDRLDLVWSLKELVFDQCMPHWEFSWTRDQWTQMLKNAIVGCQK